MDRIRENSTVKEIAEKFPVTRKIFDTYGIMCGGDSLPDKPISFFARMHNINPSTLIEDLQNLIDGKEVENDEVSLIKPQTEHIYEFFIKTSIIIVLSTGCLYGAVMLAYMAYKRSFLSVPWVLLETHGDTQVYGWVGLFIMGLSFFALPKFWNTILYSTQLAYKSFFLMVIGILLSFVFKTISYYSGGLFLKIPVFVGLSLQTASIAIFMYVLCRTYFSSEKRDYEVYEGFILSSFLWFLLQAFVFTALHFHYCIVGNTEIPAYFKDPIRHIQIVGFSCLVIIGIFTKTLPIFLGIQIPNRKNSAYVLYLLNLSIALRVFSEFYKGYTQNLHGFFIAISFISGLLEALGIFLFIYNLNLFDKKKLVQNKVKLPTGFRKYIRAALFWLFVSESAFLTFTLYETFAGEKVSHALFGAYRHAIFVGFISMMIIGCASKMIPLSKGVKLYSPKLLNVTFFLIILGCVFRVVTQPVSFHLNPQFYFLLGLSGFIEYAAIFLFSINIWKTLKSTQEEIAEQINSATASTNVYQLIRQYPQTLDILIGYGFKQLKNPVLRNTLARTISLGQAVQIVSVNLEDLLRDLNASMK
ncbi:putative membrane protein [Candidatus Kuenenia stuttgartiensis]|jgi:hypothetical protein|uniref:Putative membrane protein n=1 Tax=Kuenenia stuttgartiensis TaxID=174633 RepID=Q1Q4S6_KUEST|nr:MULTISPECIES: DUF1858 domain-containing protein [Kuenenia]MBE7547146.1 DUF1858 domain-containing protein [Planctomycetia bacterium]MBZ0190911.1 DUF1858 domain-containing protein [Candidatus Kuenenia stuttgartiensis]MCF6152057.1 DUF1858 domain-containing protein [Candidatus Kuenenia stuttgartiensis]MCL4726841.1 DUF1858 domain-containing protein [Candidatus Kuenenia stuttgartiensis]MCZ7621324.1 DUF1858 domain-containing protein [Candidatus Kuenenia sp.]